MHIARTITNRPLIFALLTGCGLRSAGPVLSAEVVGFMTPGAIGAELAVIEAGGHRIVCQLATWQGAGMLIDGRAARGQELRRAREAVNRFLQGVIDEERA